MNRIRFLAGPLALLAATAVGGCGFLSPASPPQATPTPTAVSSAEAASVFTVTICTFNDAAFAFDSKWSDLEAPLRDLQEAASLSMAEAEAAKHDLEAVTWPADIADDVLVIEHYLQQRVAKLDSVIAADTVDELAKIDFTTPGEVNSAAAEVEAFLELGADYCPNSPQTGDPSAPAAEPAPSTWTGTDSDGDDTELRLEADGSASAKVGGAVYDGTWHLDERRLSVELARADNSLAFAGVYEQGAVAINLSGTATNGHTWTVKLQRN
jgi:hypothetical protein